MKILFFAKLREQLGNPSADITVDSPTTIGAVREALAQQYADQAALFATNASLAAVNQTMVNDDAVVHQGDEVAFFPPVTGG